MDVVIYRSPQPWATPNEDAFYRGLLAHGICAELRDAGKWRVSALAVIWAHRATELFAMQRAAGHHYLVMERGYVGPIEERRRYTSLGLDGLNGHATFAAPRDPDRWRRMFRLEPWSTGDYAVVMGQVEGDASLRGLNLANWYAETAAMIAHTADCLVYFRPHPVMVGRGTVASVPGTTLWRDPDLGKCLTGARAVATFNSNTATDAVIAGVPTWACDEGSMAWDVTGHDLSVMPPTPDREAWANRLAHAQWTLDEIEGGLAWDHLREAL